jgi:hypothetical protein
MAFVRCDQAVSIGFISGDCERPWYDGDVLLFEITLRYWMKHAEVHYPVAKQ